MSLLKSDIRIKMEQDIQIFLLTHEFFWLVDLRVHLNIIIDTTESNIFYTIIDILRKSNKIELVKNEKGRKLYENMCYTS